MAGDMTMDNTKPRMVTLNASGWESIYINHQNYVFELDPNYCKEDCTWWLLKYLDRFTEQNLQIGQNNT